MCQNNGFVTSLQNYFKSGACIAHIKSFQKSSFDYYAFASRGAPWLANTKATIMKWATLPTPRPLFPPNHANKRSFLPDILKKINQQTQKTLLLSLNQAITQ